MTCLRGSSSNGRAIALHAIGSGIDAHVLQLLVFCLLLFCFGFCSRPLGQGFAAFGLDFVLLLLLLFCPNCNPRMLTAPTQEEQCKLGYATANPFNFPHGLTRLSSWLVAVFSACSWTGQCLSISQPKCLGASVAQLSTVLSVLQVSAKVNAKVQKDPQRILKVRTYWATAWNA